MTEYWNFRMTGTDPNYLAYVIQRGLMSNFAEVDVGWVTCPDLTKDPFNLTAPGLCGNTAILQIGGTGYMFPIVRRTMLIPFRDFIEYTEHYDIDNFIIGGCICPRPLNWYLGELTVDMLFTCGVSKMFNFTSKSRLTFLDQQTGACMMETLCSLDAHICSMMGNFFISEGKTGPVLRVWAKGRTGLEFIEAMQYALSLEYRVNASPYGQLCIGMGGVFIANNGRVRNHVKRNCSNGELLNRQHTHKWLQYIDVNTPVIGVGTFLNTNNLRLGGGDVPLLRKAFYTKSHCERGGFYHGDIGSSDMIEYLGYFSPIDTMYRVAANTYSPLPELSDMTSYC